MRAVGSRNGEIDVHLRVPSIGVQLGHGMDVFCSRFKHLVSVSYYRNYAFLAGLQRYHISRPCSCSMHLAEVLNIRIVGMR